MPLDTPPLDQLDIEGLTRLLGEVEALKTRILQRLCPPAPAPAPPAAEPPGLWNLTAKEVIDRTGMSRSWLYRNAHKLPFATKVGTRLRFSGARLERFLRAQGAAA